MKLKNILSLVFIIFGLTQIFKPTLNESSYDATTDFLANEIIPKKIEDKIQNSCYDCHSNISNYPWYNRITPINYWMNGHINHGKEHLNFSEWTKYSTNDKLHVIEEMIEMINEHEMPLQSYTILHPDSKLTEAETKSTIDWLQLLKVKYELVVLPIQ